MTVPLLLPFALMYFVINVAVMRHLIDRRLRTVDGYCCVVHIVKRSVLLMTVCSDALNNIVPSLVLYMYSYVVIFELVIASIMGIQKAFPLRVSETWSRTRHCWSLCCLRRCVPLSWLSALS